MLTLKHICTFVSNLKYIAFMKIFVAKLNFNTQSDELRSAFEQFGEVSSAAVVTDQETGNSKGFAFVEMPNDDEAQSAIDNLNEFDFDGNKISVTEAHDRENRDNHGYNRGGGSDHGGGGSRGDGRW
jgi:RNA recognition motif-containing protein